MYDHRKTRYRTENIYIELQIYEKLNHRKNLSRYRAIYNYKPQNEDEVELCEGRLLFFIFKTLIFGSYYWLIVFDLFYKHLLNWSKMCEPCRFYCIMCFFYGFSHVFSQISSPFGALLSNMRISPLLFLNIT